METLKSNVARLVLSHSTRSQKLMQVMEQVDQLHDDMKYVVAEAQSTQEAMLQIRRTPQDVQTTSLLTRREAEEVKIALSQIRDVQ